MAEPLPPTRRPNRLARESSPYLLQHAHNPVDWFAWGPEAFEEARRRDVPIFLSVGYATCYWCHVMERESFENEAIGRLMSERFVCVKVDREERPDVDDVYMAAVQIMTGHGGWPMSCFLEPRGLRPFWCGTYFPPVPARGMPGFPQVLEGMSSAWRAQRADVLAQAEAVAESVRRDLAERRAPAPVGVQDVGEAAQSLLRTLDGVHGGFGGAPKFPQPVFLELLLDTRDHAGDDATRTAVDHAVCLTLDRMALGGVRDQLGGGFHRYSVDATWTVPHFEKMLYDNAQLLATYARAASTYRDGFYARVAREIVEDVLATMVAPGEQAGTGGFFSALDAEVDGREGLNYLWTPEQVRAALPGADAEDAVRVFGLDRGPNFRDPHHPDAPAASVLVLADRPERLAVTLGAASAAEATARLDRARVALLSARRQRRQPRTDNKVLAAWNGLMIAALARSARMLRETLDTSAWLATAERAADFLLRAHLESGEVLRASRGVAAGGTADAGRAHTPGFLEDYALVIQGLTELDAAGSARGPDYVGTAAALAERAAALFRDADGVWFDARAGQQDLFVRPRSTHDGALPSAGSSIVHALLGLAERTGEPRWREMALDGLASLSGAIAESPVGAANAARAIVRAVALWPDATEPLASAVTRDGAPRGGAVEPEQPVEVYADRDRVLVGEEMPAELNLSMRIAPGYHITSADPGPGGQGLSPLVIGVAGGTGLAVYADFPRGEALEAGGPLVHTGPVEIRVALERQGEWTGRPMLVVQYQACTQTECLLPTAVELAVAIDRA